MTSSVEVRASVRASSGIPGLDEILGGGFLRNRLHLIEGAPGAGKTTLGMQFLLQGVESGEAVLYITLSETAEELKLAADSHGWSLEGVHIYELTTPEEALSSDEQYIMFHPAEVELSQTTKGVVEEVDRTKASRVVIDSLSEMRLLAQSPLRYRRQILALKQSFIGRGCTVLMLDDVPGERGDEDLQSIADGVLRLEQLAPEYGADRRRLQQIKMRSSSFRGGHHDFRIAQGGLQVFPRLVAAEHTDSIRRERLSSGLPALDALFGGGPEFGTSTLLLGPAGSGKSSLAVQMALSAVSRGEHAAIFIFDENLGTLLTRTRGMGFPVDEHLKAGKITIQSVDPAELSPGEFIHAVRHAVEVQGARLVVIDSLNGYLQAMPEERFLTIQLHELLTFLAHKEVLTVLVAAQHGLVGDTQAPIDASYLADNVVLLRFYETDGEVRQAIAVIKKRTGAHERTIRDLRIDSHGLHIGDPLRGMQGVLTGTPFDVSNQPPRRGVT